MTVAQLAACALLAGALGAAPESSPPPSSDHVFALAGTWTCRTITGVQTREVGTLHGEMLDVVSDVQPADGQSGTLNDRYRFDDVAKVWRVEFGAGSPLAVAAAGPPWMGEVWEIVGRDTHGVVQHIRFEQLAGGDVRRSFSPQLTPSTARWLPSSTAQRCRRGDAPPPADACVAENLPAYTVAAAVPNMPDLPPQTPRGPVRVIIGLDAQSHIVSAAVQSSPSAYLNRPALDAARASRFQTAIRDCVPIAADYLFSVMFGP